MAYPQDLVLEAPVDFIAVVERGLIPAQMRGEWARLRAKGSASVWAPASQESSHVGHAGVGVVSMRSAPLSLPTPATAQFKQLFDCGRALRGMLPVASGRFLHLVVLHGQYSHMRKTPRSSQKAPKPPFPTNPVTEADEPCAHVGKRHTTPANGT